MLCRKNENILQLNNVLSNLFLVTVVTQFTAKTANSERAKYFLCFPILRGKIIFASGKVGLGGGGLPPLSLRPSINMVVILVGEMLT